MSDNHEDPENQSINRRGFLRWCGNQAQKAAIGLSMNPVPAAAAVVGGTALYVPVIDKLVSERKRTAPERAAKKGWSEEKLARRIELADAVVDTSKVVAPVIVAAGVGRYLYRDEFEQKSRGDSDRGSSGREL